jgi:hypothetical protein
MSFRAIHVTDAQSQLSNPGSVPLLDPRDDQDSLNDRDGNAERWDRESSVFFPRLGILEMAEPLFEDSSVRNMATFTTKLNRYLQIFYRLY